MLEEEFTILTEKWLLGTISREEREQLAALVQQPEYRQLLEARIDNELMNKVFALEPVEESRENINAAIAGQLSKADEEGRAQRIHFLETSWFRYAAAVIILMTSVAIYFMFFHTSKNKNELAGIAPSTLQHQITPGSDRAVLTLSDGRKIILDKATSETISDGLLSIKNKNGQLVYGNSAGDSLSYNIMATPRGGQYKLILPDGSEVWLNAASSLKYPTTFAENQRVVELTGEAYFDVKENKHKPFVVKTGKANVTVLGTGFNINAYPDEPVIAATLVNGSIKVSTGDKSTVVRPGQQAAIKYIGRGISVTVPKMNEVLAWREGKFRFEKVPIDKIMRQISRWYDVDVSYRGDVSHIQLSGSLLRTETPYALLEAIEFTDDVRFEIAGKKITVISEKTKP